MGKRIMYDVSTVDHEVESRVCQECKVYFTPDSDDDVEPLCECCREAEEQELEAAALLDESDDGDGPAKNYPEADEDPRCDEWHYNRGETARAINNYLWMISH